MHSSQQERMVEKQKLRALVFPLPHQGHLTPTISLVLKLASKGVGITFVNFEYVHKLLSSRHGTAITEFDLFSRAQESGLDIRYTTMSDGLPDEFDRVVRLFDFYDYLLSKFQPLLDEFIGNIIRSDPDSTYFLVADTLFLWQAAAAEKFNLVRVSFWTEPALVFSLTYHTELLQVKGHFPLKENVEEIVDYVPGIPPVNTKDFMSYLTEADQGSTSFRLVSTAFTLTKKADFVLHNTVQELESSTLSALSNYQPNYAIGPINFYEDPNGSSIDKSLWVESGCSSWLQSKPRASILYISFGSLVPASKQLLEEIAHGLILSEVNFIWVARDAPEGSDLHIFPPGFESEFKERGLIVPWCNQTKVLADPAVGGFLTHCGWNSVVESIWYGVPMLCYPVIYDQPINRKLVVDDWRIGLDLCDGKTADRDSIARKIKSLMAGNISENINLQQQISNLRDTFRHAVEPDGSSERNFDRFLSDLKKKFGAEMLKME